MIAIERARAYLARARTREFWAQTISGTTSADSAARLGITTLGGIAVAATLWSLIEAPWATKMLIRTAEQAPLGPFYLLQIYKSLKRNEAEQLVMERKEKLREVRAKLQAEGRFH